MLSPRAVYSWIFDQGVRFYTGVPDSLLKDFCAYITDHTSSGEHVIAANEGNAVALAMGHFLGTGQPAMVYMQNSGIGNAVNPLLSLADPDVYSIPMLLVIGWRGEPGVKDEPQHVKQGRITTELLDTMEIPWFLLPPDLKEGKSVVDDAGRSMRERMGPTALLIRAGTFESYELRKDAETQYDLDRESAIKQIVNQLDNEDIVISTTGKASRELYEYRLERGDVPGCDFLTVGGMGHASSIAMAIAQAQPERIVVCLDGDGSTIMHMGALALIAEANLANFLHIVINNGSHDSVGGQPTAGYDIDIPAIATACGYRFATSVSDADSLREKVTELRQTRGPAMLEVRVNKGARSDLGRPRSTPIENRDALMRRLGL